MLKVKITHITFYFKVPFLSKNYRGCRVVCAYKKNLITAFLW